MIIYFTGCGNSGAVAQQLSGLTADDRLIRISGRMPEGCMLDAAADRRVVWVFPVYSWGVPPVVVRFIKNLKLKCGETVRHFLVATCGDDAGLTHKQWAKLICEKGWKTAGAWTVIMPNTYTLMKGFDVDKPELASMKLAEGDARVGIIAKGIMASSNQVDVIKGSWAWIKSRIIYPWFMKFEMSPKPFHATDDCIGCGRCAKWCPVDNISMVEGHPKWDERCAFCLGCYHVCPVHAVAYGKATRAKGQYLNPDFKAKN